MKKWNNVPCKLFVELEIKDNEVINVSQDLPTSWTDESYNDKVVNYLKNLEPDINYLAIGWDNYFPTKDLIGNKKNLFELGLQAAKACGVS